MLGGHSARRKSAVSHLLAANFYIIRLMTGVGNVLGGPEIYNVARRAFTAGLLGNKTEKILDVRLVVSGVLARFCSLSDSTRGHF